MSEEDYEIWKKWREKALAGAKWMWFDVGVGKGIEVVGKWPDYIVRSWTRITQKRIDVVIQKEAEVWIVELRHSATANAVGRLLMYDMLYMDDPVLGLNRKLVLVTDRKDEDMERLCRKMKIIYEVV